LSVSKGWTAGLTLANGNAFAITGTITIKRGSRVLGRHKFTLSPLASGSVTLTIRKADRQLLAQLGSARTTVRVGLRGLAGPKIAISKRFLVLAP
jgi:hypothetical protein